MSTIPHLNSGHTLKRDRIHMSRSGARTSAPMQRAQSRRCNRISQQRRDINPAGRMKPASRRGASQQTRRRTAVAIAVIGIFLAAFLLSMHGIVHLTDELRTIEAGQYTTRNDSVPWNLVLVNGDNPLPDDFTVSTVEVSSGELVDERILQPLDEMFTAARAAGYAPFVRSGFRTRAEQEQILQERIAAYQAEGMSAALAEREARTWVAAPGTSEHELGLAVDINDQNGDENLYSWLDAHAHEFGFIQRYPPEKSSITGISHEPWHYRYVGVEVATTIWQNDSTLEEYLMQIR